MTSSFSAPTRALRGQPRYRAAARAAFSGRGDRLLPSTDPAYAVAAVRGALLGLALGDQRRSTTARPSWLLATTVEVAAELAGPDRHERGRVAAIVGRGRVDGPGRSGFGALGEERRVGASGVDLGGDSDLIPLLLTGVALRYVDQPSRMLDRTRTLAAELSAGGLVTDGVLAFVGALGAALHRRDLLRSAAMAVGTIELRGRLRAAELVLESRARPSELRRHFGTVDGVADAVLLAITCAIGAPSFAGALHKARCAAGGPSIVSALVGVLAGARWTDAGIPARLLCEVDDTTRRRIDALAPAVLGLPSMDVPGHRL